MASRNHSKTRFHKKCAHCLCGIENNRGIWCATLKKIPTRKEVNRCRRFCPKSILDEADQFQ